MYNMYVGTHLVIYAILKRNLRENNKIEKKKNKTKKNIFKILLSCTI